LDFWTFELLDFGNFCRYLQPREVEHSIQLETTRHRTTQRTHENTYTNSDNFCRYMHAAQGLIFAF
jgi:hypothetical protein